MKILLRVGKILFFGFVFNSSFELSKFLTYAYFEFSRFQLSRGHYNTRTWLSVLIWSSLDIKICLHRNYIFHMMEKTELLTLLSIDSHGWKIVGLTYLSSFILSKISENEIAYFHDGLLYGSCPKRLRRAFIKKPAVGIKMSAWVKFLLVNQIAKALSWSMAIHNMPGSSTCMSIEKWAPNRAIHTLCVYIHDEYHS